MIKTLVERLPHWRVTDHGVATPEDVERCIVKIAEEDAALAYRLEGYVASAASRIEELERALGDIAEGLVPPIPHGHYLAHRHAVNVARVALRQALSDKR